MFLSANAGKRSLALSLRDPRGRDALLRLADHADVFLQSLRPGLAEELGLGPEPLRARNPRLVYCSVGAYGRTGPLASEPGYDALMQAAGGLISVTGEPGRPGVRVGTSTIDQGTGAWAAIGVLAALLDRERTGEGSVVDVSLYETAIGYLGYHLVGYLADGTVSRGDGTRFPMVAPYEVLATRDGALMVAAGNDRLFKALCAVLDVPDLVEDPRFRTNADRVGNRDALAAAARGASRDGGYGDLARAPHRGRHSRCTGRRRPRRRGVPADRGARDPPATRPQPHRRADATGAAALLRRRARAPPEPPAGRRRALRRDPPRGGLQRRGNRRPRRRRHRARLRDLGGNGHSVGRRPAWPAGRPTAGSRCRARKEGARGGTMGFPHVPIRSAAPRAG